MYTAFAFVAAAIVLEVASTAFLKRTNGLTEPGWTAAVLIGYGLAIWMLALAVRTLPVSVVYAIWCGLGIALVAVVGYVALGEQMTWTKGISLALIACGVVGLYLGGSHETDESAAVPSDESVVRL